MCLTVKNGTKRMRAEKDILVHKVLSVCSGVYYKTRYTTPFQEHEVLFDGDGIALEKIAKKRLKRGKIDSLGNYNISIGIHSYISNEKATIESFPRLNWKPFYAVIPAGSDYYIGQGFNVVSTELLIFRNIESYGEYASKHEVEEKMFADYKPFD